MGFVTPDRVRATTGTSGTVQSDRTLTSLPASKSSWTLRNGRITIPCPAKAQLRATSPSLLVKRGLILMRSVWIWVF